MNETPENPEVTNDELIDLISQPKKSLTRKEKKLLNKEAWKQRNLHPVMVAKEPIGTPKGNKQRMQEFKEMLLTDVNGAKVLRKSMEIAMNDDHPGQATMLKEMLARMVPVSLFEPKKGGNRTAVQINITGIGEAPITIDNDTGDVSDD